MTDWIFKHLRDWSYFNPHLPCGRWLLPVYSSYMVLNFNPHLPCGRWQYNIFYRQCQQKFQSTPSLRKVTKSFTSTVFCVKFQSTPSLRKVTQIILKLKILIIISIHTFLAEGDLNFKCHMYSLQISIHTFLAEGDDVTGIFSKAVIDFNPHLPCGRWQKLFSSATFVLHFNPHLPCGRWPDRLLIGVWW